MNCTLFPYTTLFRSKAAPDPAGDRPQQFVADVMSKRVVDALELIDVEIKQREEHAVPRALDLVGDTLPEQDTIRQLGQRVVMGEMGNPLIDRKSTRLNSSHTV